MGTPLLMTDSESEGGKGNCLRVRVQVRIDITKPLNRVRKVWSEGSVIGCAILKYECLPNFCYWCGLVFHDDRNCERWLRSKGSLKKSDQNFRDWMRAEIDLTTRKTSITVPGTRPRHPKNKKPPPHSPTAPNTQPSIAQPRDLPLTPTTIPTTVPIMTINEVINAHKSEANWQENQTSNAPNGCISGTEEATVEKSSTNDNIDDREKVLNPIHIESKTKLDLKPKFQTQHTPTIIGPCTSH